MPIRGAALEKTAQWFDEHVFIDLNGFHRHCPHPGAMIPGLDDITP
jgi:hypothetical protein